MSATGSTFVPSRPPLRGSPKRFTDLMESLQIGYVRAIAAAAGCVPRSIEIDEGIDIELTHTSPSHTAITDRIARLEIQLKATGGLPGPGSTAVSASMSQDRFNLFETSDPSVHRIVVILAMPSNQAHWVFSRPKALSVHHSAYWVNLAGVGATTAKKKTVYAPLSQPFDDVALCDMMERIGQGGAP